MSERLRNVNKNALAVLANACLWLFIVLVSYTTAIDVRLAVFSGGFGMTGSYTLFQLLRCFEAREEGG